MDEPLDLKAAREQFRAEMVARLRRAADRTRAFAPNYGLRCDERLAIARHLDWEAGQLEYEGHEGLECLDV